MFVRPRFASPRKRKKGKYRLFATSALVMSTALAARPASAQQAPAPIARNADAVSIAIPAGQLDVVLKTLAEVAGLTYEFKIPSDTVAMMYSPGVSGALGIDDALTRILEGTSLNFRRSGKSVIIEVRQLTESVEVTGRIGVVSTPKLTEPLRDIPQTITVIPRNVIDEQGATTLRDVLRNVAGITFQAGEGGVPAGDALSIRGFSARTDMFIDGVRDFGGYSRDSFNVEQVEVAKGPASAIAGRGATGGAINQVSKAPGLTPIAEVGLGGGTADYRRTTADVNQPLPDFPVPGTAIRLNAMWTDTEVANRDHVSSARWGVAPSIALGAGTSTRATIGYFKLNQDNVPEYGLPWVPVNTNQQLQAFANGIPPVDQNNFYGLVDRDYERTETDLVTVDLARDVSPSVQVRNLARWGRTVRDSVITAPRFAAVNTSTVINRQLQSRDMTDEVVSNQTNLTTRFDTGQSSTRHHRGVRVRFRDVRQLRADGAGGADRGSVRSERIRSLCRAYCPQRRQDRWRGGVSVRLCLRHDQCRPATRVERWPALGSVRGGLYLGGRGRYGDPVRAHRQHDQRARGCGVQTAAGRQRLRGVWDVLQPVG